jgi:hypothetical protein
MSINFRQKKKILIFYFDWLRPWFLAAAWAVEGLFAASLRRQGSVAYDKIKRPREGVLKKDYRGRRSS